MTVLKGHFDKLIVLSVIELRTVSLPNRPETSRNDRIEAVLFPCAMHLIFLNSLNLKKIRTF
ncbi:MAG: hypothetical protein ACON4A_02595 [Flavobacteriaceae bacterium]